MTTTENAQTVTGWFPDPMGRHEHRWWDGERWTENVADRGEQAVDRAGLEAGQPPEGAMASAGPVGRDPAAASAPRQSHEIDYEVIGYGDKFVEITLDPGEAVVAEAGAMIYIDDDIVFETKMGDGTEPEKGAMGKLFSAAKAAATGQSVYLTHFTNQGQARRKVALGTGGIIPIDLSSTPDGQVICQPLAFLGAAMGTKVEAHMIKSLSKGWSSRRALGVTESGDSNAGQTIPQRVTGDGMAFILASGTVIERELRGESLRVDTGCVVAYEPSLDVGAERNGGLRSMTLGGEGAWVTTVRGSGRVWIQSVG